MEYKCRTIPLTSLIVTHDGFINPLCEKCKTLDCTNPIEKHKVAVVGIVKELKLYTKGLGKQYYFVVDCQGFSL